MTSGASAANSAACRRKFGGIGSSPTDVDPHVAAIGQTEFLQRLFERADPGLIVRIVMGIGLQHADKPNSLTLLPLCSERPRRQRATEKRYELAPSHLPPKPEQRIVPGRNNTGNGATDVRFVPLADIAPPYWRGSCGGDEAVTVLNPRH